jgi:pimeloyl-ACP methyl ester carboxylesterase
MAEGDIIFLHGFGGSTASFSYAAKYFLKKGYRTTVLDFYGFGETPPLDRAMDLDDYVDSVAEIIGHYRMEKVVIFAHSFGGRVAVKLAADNPKIKKIVLAASAGIIPKRNFKYYFKVYSYKILKKFHIKPNAGSRDYKRLSGVMKDTFVKIVNTDTAPYLGKIRCPTLLVWGDKDAETPLYMGEIMRERIPKSRLVVFENCGHFAYLEESYKFLKATEEFLKED